MAYTTVVMLLYKKTRTRMTKGNTRRIMACLNNLVIGLVLSKTQFAYLFRPPDAFLMRIPLTLSLSLLDFRRYCWQTPETRSGTSIRGMKH